MKSMRLKCLFLLLFATIIGAYSQKGSLRMSASSTTVGVGEAFMLKIEAENIESDNIPEPDFGPFDVVSTQQQTQMVITNGVAKASKTIAYTLVTQKEGSFTIPSISYKNIASNSIKITVTKGGSTQNLSQDLGSNSSGTNSVKLQLETTKKTYYIGEQVIVKIKMYHNVDVSGYEFGKLPALEGGTIFHLDEGVADNPVATTINGKRYVARTIAHFGVIPNKDGNLVINPMSCNVSLGNGGFWSRGEVQRLTTNQLQLSIKPLPQPQPVDFTGAVGRFEGKLIVGASEVPIGKSLSVKLAIQGYGEAAMSIAKSWDNPGIWDSYGPNEVESVSNEDLGGLKHQKVFEYRLVPIKDTIVELKPSFTYFNTETGAYENAIKETTQVRFLPASASGTVDVNDLPTSLPEVSTFNWKGGLKGVLVSLLLGGFIWLALRRKKSQPDMDINQTTEHSMKDDIVHETKLVMSEPKSIEEDMNSTRNQDLSSYMPTSTPIVEVVQVPLNDSFTLPKTDCDEPETKSEEIINTLNSVDVETLLQDWQQTLNSLTPDAMDRQQVIDTLLKRNQSPSIIDEFIAIQNIIDGHRYGGLKISDTSALQLRISEWIKMVGV